MDKINIIRDKHQKIFFTSDLHFGHRNILKFCQRPFDDIKHMEKSLIENWNRAITDNDIVFILGDTFWFNNKKDMKRVFNELHGKKIYIILGNHCDPAAYEKLLNEELVNPDKIEVISDVSTIYVKEYINGAMHLHKEIVCSHYPLMTWSHRDRGAINLFGHIHSGPLSLCTVDNDLPLWKGQQYDVGADNNNYTPIEINDILKKLEKDLV